jgi:hypothetical protein
LVLAIPSALGILLAIPGFGLAYFFDDYDFLARAQTLRWHDLLPDYQFLFYRPVSREIYFALVNALGSAGLTGAHVLNALLFGSAVFLLGALGRTLAGFRTGLLAAIGFAAMGQMPVLVGWASGSQDLLAMCFILGALNLRLLGRRGFAVAATALAILSKETAIAFVPILLGMDLLVGQRKGLSKRELLEYAMLILVWAAVHPGIRSLVTRSGGVGSPSYVGFAQTGLLGSLWKTALTAVNLPLTGSATEWPSRLSFIALAAGAVAAFAIFLTVGGSGRPAKNLPPSIRVVALALVMFTLPALFTSFVVRDWLPYYACVPALGTSLLFGLALGRRPRILAAAGAVAFVGLGVWCRGMELDPTVTTERMVLSSSRALRRVEEHLKQLRPTLPSNSNVYVSAQVTGTQSLYIHVNRFQPLRVWYRDPTILTLNPRQRVAARGREFLFLVSPTLDVFEIDPNSLEPRSSGAKPQLSEYQTALRGYARGLADVGEIDRAVTILMSLPQVDETDRSYDYRQAAMYLFSAGRDPEALRLLSNVSVIDSVTTAPLVADLLLDQQSRKNMDEFALRAFGIRSTRVEIYRLYMRFFDKYHFSDPAREFAHKLQLVTPGDAESAALLLKLGPGPPADRITTAAWRDSL